MSVAVAFGTSTPTQIAPSAWSWFARNAACYPRLARQCGDPNNAERLKLFWSHRLDVVRRVLLLHARIERQYAKAQDEFPGPFGNFSAANERLHAALVVP